MTTPQPFVFERGPEVKRHAPATARNRDAIAQALAKLLPDRGLVLEIADGGVLEVLGVNSGTGPAYDCTFEVLVDVIRN